MPATYPQGGSTTPDADATTKGKLKLANDLGGTADLPTVPGLTAKAPLASPALTGNPTAPTQAQGNNSTRLATTAYVQTEVGFYIPKALLTAKGSTIGASAAGTPVDVPVGTDGKVLTADSAAAAGFGWATPSGIAATLVDAKGDLLVGTADNTVARKAAGANGTAVLADSAQSDGLFWGTPVYWWLAPSGSYIGPGYGNNTPLTSGASGICYWVPFFVGADCSVDRIGINVSTQAGTTGTARLGINRGLTGGPGALVLDAGTVSLISGTGVKEIVISQALTRGLYFAAVLFEYTGTAPAVQGFTGAQGTGPQVYSAAGAGNQRNTATRTGLSGAIPDPAAPTALNAGAPIVSLRVV